MDLTLAAILAAALSLLTAGLIGRWYLAPYVQRRPLADALTALLWFHAFRYLALQAFAADQVGPLDATEGAVRAVAFGDLTTAVLSIAAIVALRARASMARPLTWLAAIVATLDLLNAARVGLAEEMVLTATDVGWLLFSLYVPFLWVTAAMIFWQLITRRHEALEPTTAQSATV